MIPPDDPDGLLLIRFGSGENPVGPLSGARLHEPPPVPVVVPPPGIEPVLLDPTSTEPTLLVSCSRLGLSLHTVLESWSTDPCFCSPCGTGGGGGEHALNCTPISDMRTLNPVSPESHFVAPPKM